MVLYQFEDRIPTIGKDTYVAESAEVIGDVIIGDECYIGPGAKIRGDYGAVRIGNRTSIQENSVIHVRVDATCTIGDNVTVGHGSIIHGSFIRDNSIIGMGAVTSDNAIINEWSIVGAEALVTENKEYPSKSLILGVPAKTIHEITEKHRFMITHSANLYVELAKRYLKGLSKI